MVQAIFDLSSIGFRPLRQIWKSGFDFGVVGVAFVGICIGA